MTDRFEVIDGGKQDEAAALREVAATTALPAHWRQTSEEGGCDNED
jgi:hypothetical protein